MVIRFFTTLFTSYTPLTSLAARLNSAAVDTLGSKPGRFTKGVPARGKPLSLLPQNLLDLTDLFLNFAGYPFTSAFGLQLWIISQFPGDLLNLALHFVKRAFRLVPDARFHGVLLSDMTIS